MPYIESSNGYENSDLEPIAVCGMSCRLPGGCDSDSSFWRMLVEKRSGQTPKVPKSRFNIDAHYHESLERPGSFNVAGGYFLDGNPEDFDPTFFNMTPIEAQWLDPQQRKMLEVSYESLVSAGVTLQSIAGSNTGVFVGSFTADYQQMSIRDPDFRHNYAATGVDPGIISNRIGNTFNLKGPSFTINTACSSSIYALHNACHALRSRDCDAAIVGGVNLVVTVDQHMNTAKLGILSPTSTCHTFDESADGYGRAEGAGALYIKRLKDAIRDGDPIRGVVRSTAVNTNGKVEGVGITHPSIAGQERVVRMAYERARLDPNLTAYAELHGTGTPVGDPIEVEAISRAMNDTRSKDEPLLVGAVKPNIGHSEAASGIFAVMKASMMTEQALIPGVAFFNKLNPNILEKQWNVKVHTDTKPWPIDSPVRRASVSSFGYGGTNGHVIIESVESLYPWYQHAKPKRAAAYDRSSKRPFLLCFSAHDRATLTRNVKAIGKVASDYYLVDLAHTMNIHRTMFPHRAFTVAYEGREVEAFTPNAPQVGAVAKKLPSVGFLFTGQGAQWAGMARAALREFPTFRNTMHQLDFYLSRIHPKPRFSIVELLLNEEDEVSVRRINEAEVTQPLCTAIQIAIVDLFSQWNIEPVVSIGHSSGEIGAAYAAGLISAPEAITAAFCRGRAVAEHSAPGSMLAVGLGIEEVQELLHTAANDVCVACENSPSSVTLSGTTRSISEFQNTLNSKGIFARELKTGKAYHSPHMAPVSEAYDIILSDALSRLTQSDLGWRRPRSHMISSVTGELIAENHIRPGYWSTNLRQRVRFHSAVQRLGSGGEFSHVDIMVEIGPHSALSGPFKQICKAHDLTPFTYVPSMVRSKDDAAQLLSVAGSLFLAGYPVDLETVNASSPSESSPRKPKTQHLLVDLPPYQWNYEKRYWAEPRGSAEQRSRLYPRHDLLGSRVSGLTDHALIWRNVLRHRDIPWLKDHNLGGTAIFPAAGHLSIAIEALRQVEETEGRIIEGVTLRDVNIKSALVVPDSNDGVETVLSLSKPTNGSSWYTFSVESLAESTWTVHCQGRLSASHKRAGLVDTPVAESALTQRVSAARWYKSFDRVGFYYGKTFQQLHFARTDRSVHHAAGDVTVLESSGVVQGESRYLIHPSTVDACLQLIIISIHAGKHKEMPWGVVPTRIEEVTIFPTRQAGPSKGHAVAWSDDQNERTFNTNVCLTGADNSLLLKIKNLTCTIYDAALPANSLQKAAGSERFAVASWKPDIKTLTSNNIRQLQPTVSRNSELLSTVVELVCHSQPVMKVLFCGSPSLETMNAILDTVPSNASITVGSYDSQELSLPDENTSRVTTKTLPASQESWIEATNGPHDLVLVGYSAPFPATFSDSLVSLVNNGGWILGYSAQLAELLLGSSQSNNQFSVSKIETCAIDETKNAMRLKHIVPNGVQSNGEIPNGTVLDGDILNSKIPNGHILNATIHQDVVPRSTMLNGIAANGTIHTSKAPVSNSITIFSLEGSQNLRATLSSASLDYVIHEQHLKDYISNTGFGIIVDDTAGSLFSAMSSDPSIFQAIKNILTSGVRSVWLTQGVRQGQSASAGMAEGLLRTVRSEQAAARIVQLDIDFNEKADDVGKAIIDKLETAGTKDAGNDTEFWLHNGILHISRVYPKGSNQGADEVEIKPLPLGRPLRMKTVNDQTVLEVEDKQPILSETEVEIQILASEFGSTSVSQRLTCGDVVRAGSTVDRSLVGKRVVAFARDDLQTVGRTSAYALVDKSKAPSAEILLQIMAPLYPVVNACLINARLVQGDRVILLPGPEGFTSVLATLAKAVGWNLDIFVTTSDEREQWLSKFALNPEHVLLCKDAETVLNLMYEHDKKSSSGKTTVIAHDWTSLGEEVWRCIPGRCQFLVTAPSIDVAPDSLPFARGATFISSSLKSVLERPTSSADLLRRVLEILKAHPEVLISSPFQRPEVLEIDEAMASFRNSQQGSLNTVVRFSYGEKQVQVLPEATKLLFSSDETYLLVGCLGGLGRSLTRWMNERGAKHFAFLSRSGADKPEAARLITSLIKHGASPQVFRADVSNEEAVRRVVVELTGQRPIRGVVHAATVLKDGMFEQMDHPAFADTVNAKAKGALCLHKAVENLDLDFFVMTSSISALLGNTGQSNYAAANSVLDSLALQRRRSHQPATSLVLPMVLDVGVVAENEAIEMSLARKGLYGIDELEMLQGFELAMSGHMSSGADEAADSQIIMGMEPWELKRSMSSVENVDAYWFNDARFCHVRTAITGGDGSSAGSDTNSFATIVKDALVGGPEAIKGVIAKHIAQRMSIILLIPVDDFELDGPSLASYGLDSMIGAEMRTWIFKEFGLDYPFQQLLAPTLTFMALARAVSEEMGFMTAAE